MVHDDVLILGAGGAGLLCAFHAGRRGLGVRVLDHADKPGGKILVSGGGRCNFTNTGASAGQYVSRNPHFCKSALARYPAQRFIDLVQSHGIAYHEKKLGQLFCDVSARDILAMLLAECEDVGVHLQLGSRIGAVTRLEDGPARFQVESSTGTFTCHSLVVATGGLSLPKLGATGLGHQIARQFGHTLVETAPALDGFSFTDAEMRAFRELSGISLEVAIHCNGTTFREDLLFTHTGLSGPAALQASLHWRPGDRLTLDLLPGQDSLAWFRARKSAGSRALVRTLLAELVPSRLAERLCALHLDGGNLTLAQLGDKALDTFCRHLHAWQIAPASTVGYRKAEVTRGGVDTTELSSRTMESQKVPGLYFIGEVVDVTGWLGGYNFQWAWSSGWAAAQAL